MRAAIYARVSTDRQESLNQLAELREYVSRQNWNMFREYVDEDVPGKERKPQLEAMLADAHARRFDVAVFWALDRLTRSGVREAVEILHRLGTAGVGFVSVREPYLNALGPFRDAVVGIIATIAKLETERMSERIRAGITRAKAQGKRVGRPSVPPEKGAEARSLREQGLSWSQIAERTRLGRTTVRRLCQNGSAKTTAPQGLGTEAD